MVDSPTCMVNISDIMQGISKQDGHLPHLFSIIGITLAPLPQRLRIITSYFFSQDDPVDLNPLGFLSHPLVDLQDLGITTLVFPCKVQAPVLSSNSILDQMPMVLSSPHLGSIWMPVELVQPRFQSLVNLHDWVHNTIVPLYERQTPELCSDSIPEQMPSILSSPSIGTSSFDPCTSIGVCL